ncbi:hypothetical protein HK405_008269 [Cladochytrium tenue]|nr:hypothetical protein HK405_008269 [Cladochytrium tenue]
MDNADGGWIATLSNGSTAMSKHLLACEVSPEVTVAINRSAAPSSSTAAFQRQAESWRSSTATSAGMMTGDRPITRKLAVDNERAMTSTPPPTTPMDLRHFNNLPREEQQAIWHSVIGMLASEELAGFDFEIYKDLKFIEITEDRRIIMELLVRPYARNPMDNAHGGWIATAVDLVTTMAKQILALADGKPLVNDVSVSINTTYVSAAPVGCTLIFENTVPKVGAQLAFLACKIYRKNDDGSKGPVVATGTHIKYRVPSKL